MEFAKELGHAVSRRGFLKGALVGAGALSLSSRLALAEALVTGKRPLTMDDIQGNGVMKGIVQISANENPLGASPRAIEAVAQHMFEMNRYSFGTRLPFMLHKLHGIALGDFNLANLDFDNPASFRALREKLRIMISAGSGPILQTIGLMTVGDGTGEVIEAQPGYGQVAMVTESFKMTGAKTNVIRVPLTTDYKHDLNAMLKAITPKTTCVTITNPNNPTGTLISHDDLTKFIDAVPPTVMVFIDEAYIHFAQEPNYKDGIDLALSRENVIVARTFSKIYGLAGMRIGYAIAGPKMLGKLMLYSGFGGGLSVLSDAAATAAIEDDDFVGRSKKVVADGKSYLYSEFKAMGLEYIPSHTNFMMVDLKRNSQEVVRELRKRRVMIRSGMGQWNMPNFIRVSIGTQEELEVFISTLKDVLGQKTVG